jgi:predicted oxidoreductase
MGLAAWNSKAVTEDERHRVRNIVRVAYEAGINLFDHADIYAYGKSEAAFAAAWDVIPRDEIVLQSKCGIILEGDPRYSGPARYDFSYDHIIQSVQGSLQRLGTEYLDVLLLHRPDPLVEPEEVARAFDELLHRGQVRHFGVSNHNIWQMELLRSYIDPPLVVNQLELSLLHPYLISEGILANQEAGSQALATGILDYCRLHHVLIQAWSPVAGGRVFSGSDEETQQGRALITLVEALARKKDTTVEAIALGWLLRHPAGIQPILGTTRPERVLASVQADTVQLSSEEWYALLAAVRDAPVP